MNHLETLQQMYDSELNFQVSSFWDAGFSAKLGDDHNGFIWEEGQFETLPLAVEALVKAVLDAYPASTFAQNHGAGNG